jgi:hypothetical protein
MRGSGLAGSKRGSEFAVSKEGSGGLAPRVALSFDLAPEGALSLLGLRRTGLGGQEEVFFEK